MLPAAAMLLGAAEPSGPAAPAEPSLCSGGERTIFSCRAGERTISVCAVDRRSAYRSGRGGAIDIQLPGGARATTGYSGGGEMQIVHRNGAYRYVVYERTLRTSFQGDKAPRTDAGVFVTRKSRIVAHHACDDHDAQFNGIDGLDLPETDVIEH